MSEDQSRNAWFTISELNAWAERKLSELGLLAQHPPAPPDACPVCHGVGYDSSGQLCGCQNKPSPCAYPNCVGGQAGTICKPSCPGGTK